MGQYHLVVNLSKKEFIDPYYFDVGLKAWEQIINTPSTPHALFALLLCSNGRGGGDLAEAEIIGRWAGDQIAVVGDYSEDGDIKHVKDLSKIYGHCDNEVFKDVSHLVRPVIEREMGVVYVKSETGFPDRNGQGWAVQRASNATVSALDG